jgi:hypothetical protein
VLSFLDTRSYWLAPYTVERTTFISPLRINYEPVKLLFFPLRAPAPPSTVSIELESFRARPNKVLLLAKIKNSGARVG